MEDLARIYMFQMGWFFDVHTFETSDKFKPKHGSKQGGCLRSVVARRTNIKMGRERFQTSIQTIIFDYSLCITALFFVREFSE